MRFQRTRDARRRIFKSLPLLPEAIDLATRLRCHAEEIQSLVVETNPCRSVRQYARELQDDLLDTAAWLEAR